MGKIASELLAERLLERRVQLLEADLETRRRGGPGSHYYQSGDIHPQVDDQTIAP